MMRNSRGAAIVVLCVLASACAPAAPTGTREATGAAPAAQSGGRTLTSVLKVEPESLAAKPVRSTGTSVAHAVRIFNAGLAMENATETPLPYLAEGVPQLNTDTWRVLADGRMETTWRLRSNVTWHDGALLTADDFAFAWQVYATPALGNAALPPINLMEEVSAPDDRTVVIRWRRPYPQAAVRADEFQALPRHVLGQPFTQVDADAFANHPFWSTEYVGLGPYRLERWEPGAIIVGRAFDGHVLGRAKIERIAIKFIADENTGLANLLAGEAQFVTDRTIRWEQAVVLKREWASSNGGTVILTPNQPRFIFFQHRPEYVSPSSMLDLRVRRALVHSVDKQALNEGLFDGEGLISDTHITQKSSYYAAVDRALVRYPYDARRTEALLIEAGFSKGADGNYLQPGGEVFRPNLLAETVGQFQREMNILVATWRGNGVDAQPTGLPSSQLRDGPARAVFPSILSASASPAFRGGTSNLGNMTSSSIKTERNNWRGSNFGGWSNPDFDRLWEEFNTTLDQAQRTAQVVEMVRLISIEVPMFDLYWNFNVSAHSAALRGPDPQAIDWLVNWNVHEWELR